MTIQQLHYAITISETGSLNKAAELLYVAQPSLTGSMQDLERELGITIFHRSGRGVSLTNDGLEFITYARQVYQQYETLMSKYGKAGKRKKKFGVSTQHYSFAVKSFVEMVKQFDTEEYEFAVRETKTKDVIDDVITSRSEIGILYLSDFNRMAIESSCAPTIWNFISSSTATHMCISGRSILLPERSRSASRSFPTIRAFPLSREPADPFTLRRKSSVQTSIRGRSRQATGRPC